MYLTARRGYVDPSVRVCNFKSQLFQKIDISRGEWRGKVMPPVADVQTNWVGLSQDMFEYFSESHFHTRNLQRISRLLIFLRFCVPRRHPFIPCSFGSEFKYFLTEKGACCICLMT